MKKWISLFTDFARGPVFKWLLRTAFVLAFIGLVLAAVLYLGRITLDDLRDQERYKISFHDIECQPPTNISRAEFLEEVQYLAKVPNDLHSLDEQLPESLSKAFAKHPWVKHVAQVRILPPDKIRVQLEFRKPALAVKWNGALRAVDADGVLLPVNASTIGLPLYTGKALEPQGAAGQKWGDPAIQNAAQLAGQSTSAASKN